MNYKDKKEELLERSKKQNEIINSVLNSDGDNLVFNSETRNKIEELQKKSKVILEKLDKDEFEIAIVGQENCGKSSLLNALIKTDMFPSASGRLTYTSAELIAGKKDEAFVTLYSYDEFNKLFLDKLKSIRINNFDLKK